jgi:hypothetical protein
MSLSRRQQQRLNALGGELRADPRLAGLLDTFSRLAAADPMPGHEQLPPAAARPGPLRAAARAIAWLTYPARRRTAGRDGTGNPDRASGQAATRPDSPP